MYKVNKQTNKQTEKDIRTSIDSIQVKSTSLSNTPHYHLILLTVEVQAPPAFPAGLGN
jgi:hypothetical protein